MQILMTLFDKEFLHHVRSRGRFLKQLAIELGRDSGRQGHCCDSLCDRFSCGIFELIRVLHLLEYTRLLVKYPVNADGTCLQEHKDPLLVHAVFDLVYRCGRRRRVYSRDDIRRVGIENYARVVVILHKDGKGVLGKSIFLGLETMLQFAIKKLPRVQKSYLILDFEL
jgi:hypothetical protein